MAYNVKFLKGTLANYQALVEANTVDVNTFYYTEDEANGNAPDLYLGTEKLSNADDIAAAVSRIEANENSIKSIQAELDALVDPDGTGSGSISTQISNLRTELMNKIEDNSDAIKAEETRAKEAESALSDSIGLVNTGLSELRETVTGQGESITSLETEVGTLKTTVESHMEDYRNLRDDVADLDTEVGTLSTTVSTHTTQLTTLIGEDENLSVRSIAAEELAKQLIPESAQDSLDTLEEIAAWIQSHPQDVSEINLRLQELETTTGNHTTTLDDLSEQIESILNADTGLLKQAKGYTDYQVGILQDQITGNDTDITNLQNSVQTNTDAIAAINNTETGILAQTQIKINQALADLGLGTAAYEDVTAFDAAGSAAAALNDAKAYTNEALSWGTIN